MPFLTEAEFAVIHDGDPENIVVQKLLKARGIELSDDPGAVVTVVIDGLPHKMSVYREDLGTIHKEM